MVVIKNCWLFLKFGKRENRLDEFFFSDVGGLSDYSKLSKVIKMILVLFHGQGCIERGFSVNKEILQLNLGVVSKSENDLWSFSFKWFIPTVNYNKQGV